MDSKTLNGAPAMADMPDSEVALGLIQENPYQPRKSFDSDELAALATSVRSHGILQPLVVRQVGDGYQLIAGERRLRAAREVGLASVPVHIVDFNDREVLEAALAENIQRSDLNPIEKAQGFKEYVDRYGIGHDQLAQRLGLARSTITNLVHLLDLTPEVQEGVRLGQITEAHAKLLKGIKKPERQVAVFKHIVAMGLSAKATEPLIREYREKEAAEAHPVATAPPAESAPPPPKRPAAEETEKTAHVKGLENELRQRLATPVEIRLRERDKGHIVLRFESNDDFMRLLELLRK